MIELDRAFFQKKQGSALFSRAVENAPWLAGKDCRDPFQLLDFFRCELLKKIAL